MESPNLFCGHDPTRFVEVEDNHNIFPCGACKTSIILKRLSCPTCGFSLHPLCKTSPPFLSSSTVHPQHPLTLASTPAGAPLTRQCDICIEPIAGTHYTCHVDGFDAHPLCSQLSRKVPHVLDRHHPLELLHQPPDITRCDVCHGDCSGWAYRCGVCLIDIHYWCLLKPVDAARTGALAGPLVATTTARSLIGPDNAHGATFHSQPFCFGLSNYDNIGYDTSLLQSTRNFGDGTMTTSRGPGGSGSFWEKGSFFVALISLLLALAGIPSGS